MNKKNDLLALITLVGLGWVIYKLIDSNSVKSKPLIAKASDCTPEFVTFCKRISISTNRVENLKKAHTAIRKKVRDYFDNYTDIEKPEFFIQGSYKMKTLIEPPNLKCDVDLGVYFYDRPSVSYSTIQKYLKEALDKHTTQGVELKQKCVRLHYVFDFHIDLPIYYMGKNGKTIYFGSRSEEWIPSDPRKFILWFKLKTNGKPQLVRIIRYFKSWAANIQHRSARKMPSGLALTLLTINFYRKSSRDDVAFCLTALSIYKHLNDYYVSDWSIKMPVAPYDNVIERFSNTQRNAFLNELKEMSTLVSQAVTSNNRRAALMKWRKIFGQQFEI
jgi:hypothetical protein